MARAGAVPFWGLLGAVLAIPLLAGPAGAQQPPPQAVRQIKALLAEKAQRTRAQRKVSSQFLEAQRTPPRRTVNSQLLDEQRTPIQQKLNPQLQDALRAPLQKPTAAGTSRLQTTDPDAKNERVMVDIRAEVTPAVLTRIRELGGTVINSVPKYQAIRAQIPLRAVVMLAALDEIRTIRPADEARTRGQVSTLSPASRTRAADAPVTRKDNTSEGDVAHRANSARRTHKVDGTGIGIGVISNGVRSLADRQATDDLPARVTVLPARRAVETKGRRCSRSSTTWRREQSCISRQALEARPGWRRTSRRSARPVPTSSSTTSDTSWKPFFRTASYRKESMRRSLTGVSSSRRAATTAI